MSRRIDDYEYYDRPFNHRASARHYYYHNSRHIGGGASAAVAALVAVVVVLILQVWTPLSSQTASTRTAVAEMEPPISRDPTNTRLVTADDLNLREDPSNWSEASYILPKGTEVTLLGEAHRDLNNNVWLRVSVQTPEGRQSGWVHERYIAGAKKDILQYYLGKDTEAP